MKGIRSHTARLTALASDGEMITLGKALFVCGDLVRTTAQRKITAGSVSGKGHVASLPGEAPNNDTSVLANNIETVAKRPLLVEVSSNAPYAAALEFGTSKMQERPYMRPSRDETRPEIVRILNTAYGRIVKRSGRNVSD